MFKVPNLCVHSNVRRFLIVHPLATIKIIVLESGRIIKEGTSESIASLVAMELRPKTTYGIKFYFIFRIKYRCSLFPKNVHLKVHTK